MEYSSDNILNYLNKSVDQFYQNLINIDTKLVLKGDTTCLRKGLTVSDNIIKFQKCEGCRLISGLFSEIILPLVIKIPTGIKKNYILIPFTSEGDNFKIEKDNNVLSLLKLYNDKIKDLYSSEKHPVKTDFYGTNNPDLNFIIVSVILNKIMEEKDYPFFNNFVYHYICNYKINYYCYKYETDIIQNLKNSFKKILIQLIVYFKSLSEYYYLHNEPSIEFLKFEKDLVDFHYEEKHIFSPIKVHIIPSKFSSITIKGKRFFNINSYDKNLVEIPLQDFDIDINNSKNYNDNFFDIEYVGDYKEKRILFYKIGNKTDQFLEVRRHKGIPLVSKSFDIICFLISLLLQRDFYDNFMDNYQSLIIWRGLWKKDEYEKLMYEINDYIGEKENNFELVLFIIKKYYIRFDALEYLYNSFL